MLVGVLGRSIPMSSRLEVMGPVYAVLAYKSPSSIGTFFLSPAGITISGGFLFGPYLGQMKSPRTVKLGGRRLHHAYRHSNTSTHPRQVFCFSELTVTTFFVLVEYFLLVPVKVGFELLFRSEDDRLFRGVVLEIAEEVEEGVCTVVRDSLALGVCYLAAVGDDTDVVAVTVFLADPADVFELSDEGFIGFVVNDF